MLRQPRHRQSNVFEKNNAIKRVYGLMLAIFVQGVALGLLTYPAVAYHGLLAWALIGLGLMVQLIAVTRWRDPL